MEIQGFNQTVAIWNTNIAGEHYSGVRTYLGVGKMKKKVLYCEIDVFSQYMMEIILKNTEQLYILLRIL